MSEERKVFKIEKVLALLAGKTGGEVSELLFFLTQQDLDAQGEAMVAPLAKAWLCSQHPPFMDCRITEDAIYEDWIAATAKKIGDNVSLKPISEDDLAPILTVIDTLAQGKATVAEQVDKIAELEAKVAELAPFEGKAADLEKKVAGLEGDKEKLNKEVVALKKETAAFQGKLPVAESELNDTIKDIVTKALKNAVAAVPAGAVAGAAEGGEAAAEAAPEEATSSVPDDFGFGASGSDGDGFGF